MQEKKNVYFEFVPCLASTSFLLFKQHGNKFTLNTC